MIALDPLVTTTSPINDWRARFQNRLVTNSRNKKKQMEILVHIVERMSGT